MTGLRLGLATGAVLVAFAANSVLNRAAVGPGLIAPADFARLRLVSGALVLAVPVRGRGFGLSWRRVEGAAALILYLAGFSLAYLALPAGTGALILFGTVQVTMFAGALRAAEPLPPRRWAGAGLALAGLAVLGLPGAGAPRLGPSLAMAAAGLAWGVYSLLGRAAREATAATAGNFLLAVPLAVPLWLPAPAGVPAQPTGLALAVVSGAVTSGLGYALWYAVLPQLGAARAAVAQLAVPLIAAAGGLALLDEPVGWRLALAAAMILGGVAWGLSRGGRSG